MTYVISSAFARDLEIARFPVILRFVHNNVTRGDRFEIIKII